MAYTPKIITDRIAQGDDIFKTENLSGGRIRLIPDPDSVTVPGTDVNRALMQPWEDGLAALDQIKETIYVCTGTEADTLFLEALVRDTFSTGTPQTSKRCEFHGIFGYRTGTPKLHFEYGNVDPQQLSRLVLDFSNCVFPEVAEANHEFLRIGGNSRGTAIINMHAKTTGLALNENVGGSYNGLNDNFVYQGCSFVSTAGQAYHSSYTANRFFDHCFFYGSVAQGKAVYLNEQDNSVYQSCVFDSSYDVEGANSPEVTFQVDGGGVNHFYDCTMRGGLVCSLRVRFAGQRFNNCDHGHLQVGSSQNYVFNGCRGSATVLAGSKNNMFIDCEYNLLDTAGDDVTLRGGYCEQINARRGDRLVITGVHIVGTTQIHASVRDLIFDGNSIIVPAGGAGLEMIGNAAGCCYRITNNTIAGGQSSIFFLTTNIVTQNYSFIMGNSFFAPVLAAGNSLAFGVAAHLYYPQYGNTFPTVGA